MRDREIFWYSVGVVGSRYGYLRVFLGLLIFWIVGIFGWLVVITIYNAPSRPQQTGQVVCVTPRTWGATTSCHVQPGG
jgi:hypothetical protein